MRRFDIREVSEDHYRALRLLITLNMTEGHIVVRSGIRWPPPLAFTSRQRALPNWGDAIN